MQLNVTLDIPKDVYNLYNEAAVNKDIQGALSDRLTKCADHTSQKPIYLSDEQRQRLEQLIGYNLSSPEQLVSFVERLVTLNVGKAKVRLSADLLGRLKSRCFGNLDFDKFVADQVRRDLEVFVGLR